MQTGNVEITGIIIKCVKSVIKSLSNIILI